MECSICMHAANRQLPAKTAMAPLNIPWSMTKVRSLGQP
jgi:hypothetical protein